MSYSEVITYLRARKGWTQAELADKVELSDRVQVARHEKGEVKPQRNVLFRYAKAFGIPLAVFERMAREGIDEDAIEEAEKPKPRTGGIPFFSEGIPASPPEFKGPARPWSKDTIARQVVDVLGITDPQAYACRVDGDSMAPEYIPGEVVFVSPQHVYDHGVQSGRVYLVWFNAQLDEAGTMKRVIVQPDGQFQLVPVNPRHDPKLYDPKMITKMDLVIGHLKFDTAKVAPAAPSPAGAPKAKPKRSGDLSYEPID